MAAVLGPGSSPFALRSLIIQSQPLAPEATHPFISPLSLLKHLNIPAPVSNQQLFLRKRDREGLSLCEDSLMARNN